MRILFNKIRIDIYTNHRNSSHNRHPPHHKGNATKISLWKFIFSVALIIPFFILKTSTNAKINKEKITEETKVTPAGSAPRTLLAPLTYTWAIPMRYSWHIFNKGCKNSCSNNSLKTYGLIFRLFKKTLRENNI